MNSEASDLINIGIENGETQNRGELLAATQRGFEELAKRKRPYVVVGLEAVAHSAGAEIGLLVRTSPPVVSKPRKPPWVTSAKPGLIVIVTSTLLPF